jgi:hypothetical protein
MMISFRCCGLAQGNGASRFSEHQPIEAGFSLLGDTWEVLWGFGGDGLQPYDLNCFDTGVAGAADI